MANLHDNVIRRLEDAGRTIMQSPMPKHGMPAGHKSNWPDVVQRFWDVMGHAEHDEERGGTAADRANEYNDTKITPSNKAEDECREALHWLWYIKKPKHRRIVAARMLMHPVDDKHIKTFRALSNEWGVTEITIRSWHSSGIDSIVLALAGWWPVK